MGMKLKLSFHARMKHSSETWNAATIRAAYEAGQLTQVILNPGKTADDFFATAPDGSRVFLSLSKEKNGERVVITGYQVS
jgi:hypothetical protein